MTLKMLLMQVLEIRRAGKITQPGRFSRYGSVIKYAMVQDNCEECVVEQLAASAA